MIKVTVTATASQLEAVSRLAQQGAAWSERDMGQRAGFTQSQWRDFYRRLRAAGLLIPKGNGPRAGYEASETLMGVLERRPWAGT